MPKFKQSESTEMYLETLYLLEAQKKRVRQVDLAKALGFQRSSVHVSVRNLIAMGLVSFEDETYVRLTEEGRCQAAAIYEKHELFARFLRSIGVDELVAQQDACKIEHVVSPETVEKLKEFFSTQIEKK